MNTNNNTANTSSLLSGGQRGAKKSDLALQYLPYYTAHSAVNKLMSWIKNCPQLMEQLIMSGYRKTQKELTPMQVQLIYEYIGEP